MVLCGRAISTLLNGGLFGFIFFHFNGTWQKLCLYLLETLELSV